PEPTDPSRPRTVLVYDLGGGTFDVTLVRLSQKRFQTLAIEGDVRLGGKDWDDKIVDHVAGQFLKQAGDDPRSDPQSLAALHAGITAAHRRDSRLNLEPAAADALGQVVEINVNAHGLGIEVKQQEDRVNDVLIPKNTQLPTAASRVYYTVGEGQSKVRVKVLQGEARQPAACISIGECWIE